MQGTLPIQWKSAIVISIHKKSSRDHPGNYRPISITCVLCCVLEHIIANKLLHHFHCNNLLSVNQFGFLPGRFSCSQLLTVLNKRFSKYDNNDQVDIVYTNIAKAFDNVSHSKLISVLNFCGVNGNLLNWIKVFLCNRNQKVSVNNSFSSTLEVYSAVFPLTLWLIGEYPNFLHPIVPKALKRRLCALNFTPIQYLSILNAIFPQICRISLSYVYCIAKNYLPLLQQIANSLKKIGLVGTLVQWCSPRQCAWAITFCCIY